MSLGASKSPSQKQSSSSRSGVRFNTDFFNALRNFPWQDFLINAPPPLTNYRGGSRSMFSSLPSGGGEYQWGYGGNIPWGGGGPPSEDGSVPPNQIGGGPFGGWGGGAEGQLPVSIEALASHIIQQMASTGRGNEPVISRIPGGGTALKTLGRPPKILGKA